MLQIQEKTRKLKTLCQKVLWQINFKKWGVKNPLFQFLLSIFTFSEEQKINTIPDI